MTPHETLLLENLLAFQRAGNNTVTLARRDVATMVAALQRLAALEKGPADKCDRCPHVFAEKETRYMLGADMVCFGCLPTNARKRL